MISPRDILIAVVGSHGDVHPFIAIGKGLRDRGHRVRVIVNPHFASIVRGAGLEVIPFGTDEEYRALASHPDLWHPLKGPKYVFREMGALIPGMHRAIVEHYSPGRTVVVHSSLALGARVAQETHGIPTVTVHLQPAVIRSSVAVPKLPGMPSGRWVPRVVQEAIWFIADWWIIDPLIAPELNAFRAGFGLPPVRRVMNRWWDSPLRVIGLFPEWYARPQADWQPQVRLTGFGLYDESDQTALPEAVAKFLDAGAAPIAFTPGSAMWRGHEFFEQSVRACGILGRRGLLLSRHGEHIPARLPAEILHVEYAPFSQLLPRCAALVHHGGIGTTAQAMASGTPQLITPFTHDQPDNAARVEALGIGVSLPPRKFRADRIADRLAHLLSSPHVAGNCRTVSERFQHNDAIEKTCRLIEELG